MKNDRKRDREDAPEPVPSFGSVGVVDSLPAVVEALKKVKENSDRCAGKLATITSLSIVHILRLLHRQTIDGESKRDLEKRLALGKKYALLILALLVDGDNHVGSMDCLSIVLTSDPSGKSIDKVLKDLGLTGGEATGFLHLTATRCTFAIEELAELIPRDNQSVEVVLTQRNYLKLGHHFGKCKVWCPSGTHDKGFDRHIAVDPLYDVTVENIRNVMADNRAALVCGESGSGKTFSSVLSAGDGICIYLTANDFSDGEKAFRDSLRVDAGRKEQETQGVATADFGSKPAQLQQHSQRTLTSALGTLVREVASRVGSLFAGPVVLVVDEVGGHPLLVKELCREAKDIVKLLRGNLRLTGSVGVVACGTGSETGGEALGSYPDTYRVIVCEQKEFTEHVMQLIDAWGFSSLAGLLHNRPIAKSHYGKKQGKASSLSYVQRLLANRRFAAALLVQLKAAFPSSEVSPSVTPQIDASVPWLTVLPWLTSAALLQFKALNGLSGKSFDSLRVLFADALAICFGGHQQVRCATSRMLHQDFGMIVDNARSVLHADAELMVPGDCLNKRYVLALPKQRADEPASGTAPHFGRRFGMGPATLEMGLQGFSLSTAARARSGDGLEHTMVDFFYCWALACCSSVGITLPGEAPGSAVAVIPDDADHDALARRALFSIMAGVRDTMRKEKVCVVLRARLTKATKTVKEAVEQAFEVAQEMIHENGVPFVVVAHTAPLAPFADVVVVAGVTSRAAELRVPTMFVAVQLKHLTATVISPWDAFREHLKQGCPLFDTKCGQAVVNLIRCRGNSKKEDLEMLVKARALLKAASTNCESQFPFVSLVLVVCPEDFAYPEEQLAVEQFAAMTTVRIRSGVLRSVVHPIPLGSDPQCSADSFCFDDCVKNDFRVAS